tara:strand:+ start:110 stop:580 length:471 start_codon:yes stop_codon:yes gene_type:complete
MINNLIEYLTLDNIYLIANFGVIPLWFLLIFAPNQNITKILVQSIFAPIILGSAYIFIAYKIFIDGEFLDVFNLYMGIEGLYTVYSNEAFLLVFWLHFLSLSLFVGAWITRDSIRYMIPKILSSLCLIITYFTGPIGLLTYWLIRIFYSRKINFDE